MDEFPRLTPKPHHQIITISADNVRSWRPSDSTRQLLTVEVRKTIEVTASELAMILYGDPRAKLQPIEVEP